MPKNKIGGNKSKKQKNTVQNENSNYPLADNPDLLYGIVLKKLGGKNLNVKCSDGKERIGRISGSMWKRSFMQVGDFVLISKRDFSTTDNKCDILYKYQQHHANTIISTYNITSLKSDKSNNSSELFFQENDFDEDDDEENDDEINKNNNESDDDSDDEDNDVSYTKNNNLNDNKLKNKNKTDGYEHYSNSNNTPNNDLEIDIDNI